MTPIQLETLGPEVWGWLEAALVDRRDPFRTPAVVTVGLDGIPQARTVVLRAVDAAAWTLDFYTDVRSAKHDELANAPAAAWLFYDAARSLQIRATGIASVHVGDSVADAAWASSALASRAAYVSKTSPGSVIGAPAPSVFLQDDAQAESGRTNFCAVRCTVREFDVLQLHSQGHRRAKVRADHAVWLAP